MTTDAIYKPGIRGDAERKRAEHDAAALWEAERAAAIAKADERRARAEALRTQEIAWHRVEITTRPNMFDASVLEVAAVTFVCTAPEDADCRTYPADCGCEAWQWDDAGTADEAGHPREPGQVCWLSDWFDAEQAVYTGDDGDDMRDDYVPAIDRAGHIRVRWMDEWVEWDWATPEPHVVQKGDR